MSSTKSLCFPAPVFIKNRGRRDYFSEKAPPWETSRGKKIPSLLWGDRERLLLLYERPNPNLRRRALCLIVRCFIKKPEEYFLVEKHNHALL